MDSVRRHVHQPLWHWAAISLIESAGVTIALSMFASSAAMAMNLGFPAGPSTAGLLAERSFSFLFLADAATSLGFGMIALLALPHGTRSQSKQHSASGAFRHALTNQPFVLFLALSQLKVV